MRSSARHSVTALVLFAALLIIVPVLQAQTPPLIDRDLFFGDPEIAAHATGTYSIPGRH